MDLEFREYDFKLTSTMRMLMHANDIEERDRLEAYRKSEEGKKLKKAGDDRAPAWTWQTYLYQDGTHLAVPQENLMSALMFAGAKVTLTGMTTFKQLSQSGLQIASDYLRFTVDGKQIPIGAIHDAAGRTFAEQRALVKSLGFDLSMKPCTVNKKSHVRVRPMFSQWEVSGVIAVTESVITAEVLASLFEIAGRRAGLGDWRPGPKPGHIPGPYGTFTSEIKPVKAGRKAG